MTGARPDKPLLPTVLDRLLDPEDDPRRKHGQTLAELHAAVRRDLEALLNTPQRSRSWPAELTELNRSLISYGVPDLTGLPVASALQRDSLRRAIEEAIRTHEPRFRSVTVTLLEGSPGLERMLRFRIDALMHAEPAPEPVAFDSHLNPATRSFLVGIPSRG